MSEYLGNKKIYSIMTKFLKSSPLKNKALILAKRLGLKITKNGVVK